MAHLSDEQLVWLYYGETDDIPALEIHVAHCGECRGRLESLKVDMLALDAIPTADPGPNHGEETWRALVRRDASIATRQRDWKRWLLSPRRLTLAGTLATALAITFLAGRFTGRSDTDSMTPPEVVRQRILASALSEHLEDSERILTELSNRDASAGTDIRVEQQRAESLLNANRLYRQTAQREDKPELAAVLEELERVLLEVKHSPSTLTAEDLTGIRSRMSDGLLFKVRVLEERLRDLVDRPMDQKSKKDSKG